MRIVLVSAISDLNPSGGVKRNREVVKFWKNRLDEIIYIPHFEDLIRAHFDDKFRAKIYEDAKVLGLTIPQKVEDALNESKLFKGLKPKYSSIEYRIRKTFEYRKKLHEIAKYIGKINADIYYTQDESVLNALLLSEIATRKNVGVLFQLYTFGNNFVEDLKSVYKRYSALGLISLPYSLFVTLITTTPERHRWEALVREERLSFALSVSEDLSQLYRFMKKIRTKTLRPANAFDKELLRLRGGGKEDYAVFYARLIPAKGVLEIPKIADKLKTKIIVMGKFYNKFIERKFMREKNEYVEYLGFVDDKKLRDIVSKAKLLIYPSHIDSFSLVILESLAMGTPVVAYNIIGIRDVYRGLPTVKLVKEGDIEGIVTEARKILTLPKEEYDNLINDKKLLDFLEEHSSWEKVAEKELEALVSYGTS